MGERSCAGCVLIVEDDDAIRISLKEILEEEGFSVIPAHNGAQALNILNARVSQLPNLILLDLMMPVKDGFQFRKEQLLNPLLSEIPVVVMSADNTKQSQAHETRCKSYLRKPVDIETVIATVKLYCIGNVAGA